LKVIDVIAKYNLVLETGHNTPEECLMMIRYAKQQGVRNIVVTHAMMAPIHMSIPQMQEAAAMGAYIEFVYNGLVGSYKEFEFADYARAMKAVGAEHCILGSDMGQVTNPVHTEALKIFYAGLLKAGITQNELDLMSRRNPATLLELN
jgi:predicted metal-dependent phosphotriesterase family hydrolase